MNIDTRKKNIINSINNISDAKVLSAIETLLMPKSNEKPCVFFDDEIIERIEQGEIEIENGGGIDIEELRSLHPRIHES